MQPIETRKLSGGNDSGFSDAANTKLDLEVAARLDAVVLLDVRFDPGVEVA
jgi:hypothetical protein